MKKIFALLLILSATIVAHAAYFARVYSGTTHTDYPCVALGEQDFQQRDQYLASSVAMEVNDVLKFFDDSNNAEWAISALDPYGEHTKFAASASGIACRTAGCFDVYLKLKYQDDMVYIGAGTGCTTNPADSTHTNPADTTGTNPADTTHITPVDPSEYVPGDYASAVPSRCPDVLLQGFYWDSNNANSKHGDTRWSTLLPQAAEINAYFDMVWLAPSAKSSGGVGYLPTQYSNQNSAWGTRAELEALIAAFHAGNTKVVADIVVNHINNVSSWCDYAPLDFGQFGQFTPDGSWICRDDEVNGDPSAGSCRGSATGAYDDGYGSEANYSAGRDWDHNNAEVRNMIKAYLRWMKYEMKYDGWRYDYCKGFHNSHINDYNSASQIYFSVMEYWDGNAQTLISHIGDAGNNTLTFDFATKYAALNRGIAAGYYQGCRGSGLLGAGRAKYAVTFVDSHDSYMRDDNEFMGNGNSMKPANSSKLLQANAFILSMPGIPCVFYPHWKEYKAQIGQMVLARHAVGVHSESAVSDEAGDGYYKATITGTNGELRLLLGPNSGSNTCPAGFTEAVKGTDFGVYYRLNTPVAPQLIITPGATTFKDSVQGLDITMTPVALSGSAVTIYYTTDGSDPKTSATRQTYTAAFKVTATTTVKAYAEVNGVASAVQAITYTYKDPQTTPIIVRFQKPASWTKLYLYAWGTDGTQYMNKWPGTELTQRDANGWYYHQFDASVKGVNFIFNAGSGKEQTGDLYTDEDVCYVWVGGSERLDPNCEATDLEDLQTVVADAVFDPALPTYNILGQQVDATYRGFVIQNGHKFLLY